MIWIDHKFQFIERMALLKKIQFLKSEDFVFIIAITYGLIGIVIKEKYGLSLIFGGILDYFNYEYDIIYHYAQMIVDNALLFGLVVAPITCSVIAYYYNKSVVKWFVYGFFMNFYGIIYLYANRRKST
jgi:hypothetical protein